MCANDYMEWQKLSPEWCAFFWIASQAKCERLKTTYRWRVVFNLPFASKLPCLRVRSRAQNHHSPILKNRSMMVFKEVFFAAEFLRNGFCPCRRNCTPRKLFFFIVIGTSVNEFWSEVVFLILF